MAIFDDERAVAATSPQGAALRTVTAAFTAVSEARFDDLGGLLASDIDWRGVADEDGQVPRCHGRDQALDRMRIGLLANAKVSVSSLVEEGDRVIAHVHSAADEEVEPPDCGMFDRCTVYGGEGPDGPIILETIDAVTGAIAFVIAPELRGRGLGRALIVAMLARPELRDVELFEAGIAPQNTASRRCLEAAGFELGAERPDFEGMLHYRVWRRALTEPGARSA